MSTIWEVFFQNSVLAVPFIVVIFIVRAFTRKLSRGYVYVLWLLLIVELLLPRFIFSPYSAAASWEKAFGTYVTQTQGQTKAAGNGLQTGDLSVQLVPENDTPALMAGKKENVELQSGENTGRNFGGWEAILGTWGRILRQNKNIFVVIWGAGAMCLACFYLSRYLMLRHWLADAVKTDENVWETERREAPFVLPGKPSRIYLPFGLTGTEREDILAHERAHIRALDPWVKAAGMAALCIHWYNPLVWAAISCLGKDLEIFCDERVLRGWSMERKKQYSGTLLKYSVKVNGFSFTMSFGESNTESRIQHILYARKARIIVSLVLFCVIGACAVFFLTTSRKLFQEENSSNGASNSDYWGRILDFGQITEPDREKNVYVETVIETGNYDSDSSFVSYVGIYDTTAKKEGAFVGIGDLSEGWLFGDFWYADESGSLVKLLSDVSLNTSAEYLQTNADRYLLLSYQTGNPIYTDVYTVRNGEPVNILPYEGQKKLDGEGNILCYDSAYDASYEKSVDQDGIFALWTGHTWKPYCFVQSNGDWVEISAREVEEQELLQLPFGPQIIEQASEHYPEGEFQYILRENGELNVNIAIRGADTQISFYYLTFKTSGNSVTAQLTEEGAGYYLISFSEGRGWSMVDELPGNNTAADPSEQSGPDVENNNSGGQSAASGGEEEGESGEEYWTDKESVGIIPDSLLLEKIKDGVPDYSTEEKWSAFPIMMEDNTPQDKQTLNDMVCLIGKTQHYRLYGIQYTQGMLLQGPNGEFTQIMIPFTSNYFVQPLLEEQDYDGDGAEELAIRIYIMHGTGISLHSLFMADQTAGQGMQVFQLTEEFYLTELSKHFESVHTQEGLRLYVDGQSVGRLDKKHLEADYEYMAGAQIHFRLTDENIILQADLGAFSETNFSGDYEADYGIEADVRYYGNGIWNLENIRYRAGRLESDLTNAVFAYFEGDTETLNTYYAAEGVTLEAVKGNFATLAEVKDIEYSAEEMDGDLLEVLIIVKQEGAGPETYLEALLSCENQSEDYYKWKILKLSPKK